MFNVPCIVLMHCLLTYVATPTYVGYATYGYKLVRWQKAGTSFKFNIYGINNKNGQSAGNQRIIKSK